MLGCAPGNPAPRTPRPHLAPARIPVPALAVALTLLHATAWAQGSDFTRAGTVEATGGLGFEVFSAEGESLVTLSLAPSLGYFVSDGLEFNVTPELSLTSSDGDTDVVFSLLAGPSYNFDTGGSVIPFLGVSGGFIKFPDVDPRGLLGVELGLKVPVGGGGLVRPQLRLLVMTGEPTVVRLGALAGVGIFF